jgi:hypothetical protein
MSLKRYRLVEYRLRSAMHIPVSFPLNNHGQLDEAINADLNCTSAQIFGEPSEGEAYTKIRVDSF